MAKKLTGNPNGRPPKEIDQRAFESLCKIQCTENEICGFLECNTDTLNSWCKQTYGGTFSDTYKKLADGGKCSLRRSQWKSAVEDRNATMLVWLGKQMLGQTDTIQNIGITTDDALTDLLKDINKK